MSDSTAIRRSALHAAHLAAGARMAEHAGWQCPDVYTRLEEELDAARERVGLADLSPTAKLDVQGAGSRAALARRLSLAAPAVGAVVRVAAHGLGVGDGSGDQPDGRLCCLATDHLRLHAPAGTGTRIAAHWETLHAADTSDDTHVHVTDVTSNATAVQLTGPHSRALLSKLTALDLRAREFADLACAQAGLAGVQALIVRADVGGRLSFEVACGREFGAYVWEALLDAGREFDARPIGLAALRTLAAEG